MTQPLSQEWSQPPLWDAEPREYGCGLDEVVDKLGVSYHVGRAMLKGYFEASDAGTNDYEEEETIGRSERLQTVREVSGFYPTSLRELSLAFSLRPDEEGGFDITKHLKEVAGHQDWHCADADKAVATIVRGIGGFARQARKDATNVATLREELADGLLPKSALAEPYMVTGRGLTVRFADIFKLANKGISPDGPYPLVRYTEASQKLLADYRRQEPQNRAFSEYINNQLSNLRMADARILANATYEDRVAAQAFWVTQLKAIAATKGMARTIAIEELEKLGIATLSPAA